MRKELSVKIPKYIILARKITPKATSKTTLKTTSKAAL